MTVLLLHIKYNILPETSSCVLILQLFWSYVVGWHIVLPICWQIVQWMLQWIINLSQYGYFLLQIEFLMCVTSKQWWITRILNSPVIVIKTCCMVLYICLCQCINTATQCRHANIRSVMLTVSLSVLTSFFMVMKETGITKVFQQFQNHQLQAGLQGSSI